MKADNIFIKEGYPNQTDVEQAGHNDKPQVLLLKINQYLCPDLMIECLL